MHRPPDMGDPSGNGGLIGSGSANSYWSPNRPAMASTNSNESNLREIRDSLVPFKAGGGNGMYSAKSAALSQATLASSSTGTFFETSSSSVNSSSSFWSSGQQGFAMVPPSNGFSTASGNFDGSFNGGVTTSGQFTKALDSQTAKFRSANVHPTFRPTGVQEALSQIKQQLQPYSMSIGAYSNDGAGNMDTLSSESSSGTTGSADIALQNNSVREYDLLDRLVGMGFEQESAWYALKLTQFRNLHLAVDVLLKLNMSHVFRDQEARSAVSRKPSFDNGEAGIGRSESPMPRIPTPQGRQQYQPGASAQYVTARPGSSAVSTSGAVYSIPISNHRTPSPMSNPMGNAASVSNYVNVVPPLNFGPTTTTSTPIANQSAYMNGGDPAGYLASTGGPKRSHITVNLQSPPRNGSSGNGSGVADSHVVRERAAPVMQADKRQVEKPIAQTAVSPTIIAVNNYSPSLLGQSKLSGIGDRQDATPAKSQSTRVLSAHFEQPNLKNLRIDIQGSSNGGQHSTKYLLEASTTSGHVVSIQGRGEGAVSVPTSIADLTGGEAIAHGRQNQQIRPALFNMKLSSQRIILSPPFDPSAVPSAVSSLETFSNHEMPAKAMSPLDYSMVMAQLHQQQQQHPQQKQHPYRHHIVVDGNGSGDNSMATDESPDQQQAFSQRLKSTTPTTAAGAHGQHQTTNIPLQKKREAAADDATKAADFCATPESLPTLNPSPAVGTVMPFVPLPARLPITRTLDCFSPLQEEAISQTLASRTDGASPTSSVSTEESESSGCGGNVAASASRAANVGGTDQPVRCESPLPDSVLQWYNQCNQDNAQASASNSGNSGGNARCVKPCTPQAFKFYMEQHIENVIKQHQERQTRRMQLEKEMVKAKLSSQVQCHMRKLLNNKESNYLRMKRQKMNASMFEMLKAIGVGAFGEVSLVRKKDTGTLFAMKTLRKADVIQKNQTAHVKAERDILSEADNEWVVKLFYSFQDKEHLFFIMEYIPGGDMMALLIKKGIFEEDLARFYIAELVCAIQSVHKLGFIHRDIKPDNILIDRNGHIKLTDFGLCTGLRWTHDWKYYAETPKLPGHTYQDSFDKLQSKDPYANHKVLAYRQQKPRHKSHSVVGTPNYIAPEVLVKEQGHTQLCDWWSVGVILYEMVFGTPPFNASTPEETQENIVKWRTKLKIPGDRNVSYVAIDLILRLCCGVEERLGRERNAHDIMSHPFFETIDWPRLRSSPAPYRPEILHAMDTSNFDPVEPRPDMPGAGVFGTEKMSKHDHAFYEFTFRRFFDSDGHGCPTLRSRQPYHHPSLDTVMERNTASVSGEDLDEKPSTSSIANSRVGAFSRTPIYVNEREMNILRISMDDSCAIEAARRLHYEDAEEAVALYSGPGRPTVQESFSFDDPSQAPASDIDGETSDSAVYV